MTGKTVKRIERNEGIILKHLKINNLQPVQENFWGNGAIYHGFAGMPDDACRIYTEQQCDMEADRAADMRLKLARTFIGGMRGIRRLTHGIGIMRK